LPAAEPVPTPFWSGWPVFPNKFLTDGIQMQMPNHAASAPAWSKTDGREGANPITDAVSHATHRRSKSLRSFGSTVAVAAIRVCCQLTVLRSSHAIAEEDEKSDKDDEYGKSILGTPSIPDGEDTNTATLSDAQTGKLIAEIPAGAATPCLLQT
jgi:hypothetical protein